MIIHVREIFVHFPKGPMLKPCLAVVAILDFRLQTFL
jgi:hypothetical protein